MILRLGAAFLRQLSLFSPLHFGFLRIIWWLYLPIFDFLSSGPHVSELYG